MGVKMREAWSTDPLQPYLSLPPTYTHTDYSKGSLLTHILRLKEKRGFAIRISHGFGPAEWLLWELAAEED